MENKTNTTLYFEGAGWFGADSSKNSDLGNCRIRTAFTNNDGKQIYLELGIQNRYNDKMKVVSDQALRIDFVHYITDGNNDCNENRINYDWEKVRELDYTKANVLAWINENLNCSFEAVQVLPDLAGYRVHKDRKGHNFGDIFEYDPVLTAKRTDIYDHYYQLEKEEGKKFPNFSLWVDETDKNILHLLRHFPGSNKHWTINTSGEGWKVEETTLGKYAC